MEIAGLLVAQDLWSLSRPGFLVSQFPGIAAFLVSQDSWPLTIRTAGLLVPQVRDGDLLVLQEPGLLDPQDSRLQGSYIPQKYQVSRFHEALALRPDSSIPVVPVCQGR